MKKKNQIATVGTFILIVLSLILLQFPCQSSFPFPSLCLSYAIYLIFNFPAVIIGIALLQLFNNPAQYVNGVYYVAIFVNAIWWFYLLKYIFRRKK